MAAPAASSAALRLVTFPVRRAVAEAAEAATRNPRRGLDAFLFAWRGDASAAATATTPTTTATTPTTTTTQPSTSSSLPPISAATTLSDRAVLLAAHAREAGERRLEREWRAVEGAPPGTLKGWLHRLANAVLSRSDPTEAALARIPRSLDAHSPAVAAAIRRARGIGGSVVGSSASASASASSSPSQRQQNNPNDFQILHPSSLDPRFVRRFLRRLCQKRAPEHRRGALLWALALVPQAPLSVLPLPNVTIYYTLWRAYMHWSASIGAQSLMAALDRLSDEQRRALMTGAAAAEAAAATARRPGANSSSPPTPTPLPAPLLVARDDLPSPLTGPADAERLAELLQQPHIVERYAALARRMERRRRRDDDKASAAA